ncbi:MAG: excinuclease ABC subunit UvrA [Bacteroides sp.]|nr:excinuclease ABC subunit UvrA [Bacteroides sp.]MCM1447298.1 excinuclease ABC subunit UvrA [Bacteroides sp.]
MSNSKIIVEGAREHNLKNVDVEIPRGTLTVITGLSGSGKSSLAFDTIYAEGQRRYIETFSAYARNFLGGMSRPDVDKVSGLSPVISIEQKTTNRNPRSTVGTTTEIYDFLRLLYARVGEARSYVTGEKMVRYTEEQIVELLLDRYEGTRVYILAPIVRNRKGHYRELLESVRKKGYLYARIDGEMEELLPDMQLDRYKNHDIEVVVDKLRVARKDYDRLRQSVSVAMQQGSGLILLLNVDNDEVRHYSKRLMCPTSGIAYRDPAPHDFSFNSPQGACPRCKGLGYVSLIDEDKIFPDHSLSVRNGGIAPLGKARQTLIFWQIQTLLERNGYTLDTPVGKIGGEVLSEILHGCSERLRIPAAIAHTSSDYFTDYDGLVKYINQMQDSDMGASAQKWAEQFNRTTVCPECHGQRLKREALHFFVADKNIAQLADMELGELYAWLSTIEDHLTDYQRKVAPEILKEIRTRLHFLLDIGLDYLSLSRTSVSLSGGESQRIRLATQIGSQLVNVLYILDEPSIGLHQKDNSRLISSLKALRDIGNTVIVVEHDQEMMENADWIVDIGPRAGRAGGNVVYQGTYPNMLKAATLTSRYLSGDLRIEVPVMRREGNGKFITIHGAKGNNLQNITVSFPLGTLICVTGVSGSGKSTLINDTLHPILSQHFYRSLVDPLPYDSIDGLENIDKVVDVDQTPLGRTPRSNPATYTNVFNDIRNLFVDLPEAKIRGYKPGRFSFNVKGGRCETCLGNGYRSIEMNFLPDVMVPCEECRGKRYNRETLEVRFRGKSIADILDMTVNQAVEFFENQPNILQKIKVLQDVGLGYIKLGQPSTTLSGGESQRVKLATELAKRDTGRTLYILDEPTTGLHFEDINVLLSVLNRLVDKGNTVVIVEHNLDVIKCADYLIEMGPDGGRRGGQVLFSGTPEELVRAGVGYTSHYLDGMLIR